MNVLRCIAVGVVAIGFTSCSTTGDSDVAPTSITIATTTTATTTTAPDPLLAACAVVNNGFVPLMVKQLEMVDVYGAYAQRNPRSTGDLDRWRYTNRELLQGLFDDSDALVLDTAELINDDNPHGDALLAYAISSRRIVVEVMESPPDSFEQIDPALLDDEDEFQAFQVVRARCEALGR